jgi:hypothetical protein
MHEVAGLVQRNTAALCFQWFRGAEAPQERGGRRMSLAGANNLLQ